MFITLACTFVTLLFFIDKVILILRIKLRSHRIDTETKTQPLPFILPPVVRSR